MSLFRKGQWVECINNDDDSVIQIGGLYCIEIVTETEKKNTIICPDCGNLVAETEIYFVYGIREKCDDVKHGAYSSDSFRAISTSEASEKLAQLGILGLADEYCE